MTQARELHGASWAAVRPNAYMRMQCHMHLRLHTCYASTGKRGATFGHDLDVLCIPSQLKLEGISLLSMNCYEKVD